MINLLAFIDKFTFDTLLALISCIAAVLALILGGKAYYSYKKTINYGGSGKKVMRDGSDDHSQQAKSITNVYGLDTASSTALLNFTRDTFKDCMDRLYASFELQRNTNMQTIIELSNKIIQDKKLEIASYTKIDWINIYFESAKNSSDVFMQNVWAKVLAKELSCPNSFSYKSLDILKNLTAEDFILFQKLCSIQVDGYVLNDDLTKEYGLTWVDHLKLRDNLLLNLDNTVQEITIYPKDREQINYQDRNILIITNNSEKTNVISFEVFPLSSFGLELAQVAEIAYMEDYLIKYAHCIRKNIKNGCKLSLHRINHIENGKIDYDDKNLLEE